MKKIISLIICMILAFTGAITSSAAVINNDSSVGITLGDFENNCRVIGNDTIPNNTARLYTYGQIGAAGNSVGISFIDSNTYNSTDCVFNSRVSYQDVYLPSPNYYASDLLLIDSSGSDSSSGPDFSLTKSGGNYRKVRVKLSEYSNYFNSDGTHTKDGYRYSFTYQEGGYLSSLLISSGGAVTAVTPDHYGFVEFYCSTQIGVPTVFSTNFSHRTSTSYSGGGGISYQKLPGFMVGDTNSDGSMSIYDATYLQMHLTGTNDLSDAAEISADVNLDGKVDVDDVTNIQKHLANLI